MNEKQQIKQLTTGQRLKAMRLLTGLVQDEFAEIIGMPLSRLKNVETRSRMYDHEIEDVLTIFPEFAKWLSYQGDITLGELQESQSKLCRIVAAKLDAGIYPEGYDLENKIK
ncbi:helix-turn-helix domain-containing protein [Dasania marina]|uniref:helix-turn-helix domain-containing protein n=1 Tax=Dasania marina TaxID=471499 RepID=UPI00035E0446|nr:helix-turn-helix transcriptional regulator [Dasania marina]